MRSLASALRSPILIACLFALIHGSLFAPARAQTVGPGQDGSTVAAPAPSSTDDDVRALIGLLGKPEVRDWLARQAVAEPPEPAPASSMLSMMTGSPMAANSVFDLPARIATLRLFLGELAAAFPLVPAEIERVTASFGREMMGGGIERVLALVLVFVGSGLGVEWGVWWLTRRFRRQLIGRSNETPEERLNLAGLRFGYGLTILAAFSFGSVGAFLLFNWPPLLGRVVLDVLEVVVLIRLVLILGRVLLAPGAERFRLTPMASGSARFWFVWCAVLVGYFVSVRLTLQFLHRLGMSGPEEYAVGIVLGLGLLAIAEIVLWTYPDGRTGRLKDRRFGASTACLSAYLVVIWALLFTGSITLFYLGLAALLVPLLVANARLTIRNILRPEGTHTGHVEEAPSLRSVVFDRGAQALILLLSVVTIALILDIDLITPSLGEPSYVRATRAVLDIAIVVFVADLVWRLVVAFIDHKVLASGPVSAHAQTPGLPVAHGAPQNRLRTVLPALKTVILTLLAVTAATTVLSTLGVQIAPLVASAGIVGIAIGFGAQTLVKDVISGFFFLFDDAFRVGEYIESGNLRGTVESFSLRSLKIRHHRGAVHTVPFGALEKITNYSRDWVIDKLQVGVTYDTDLGKAKQVIKQIGRELAEAPEFKPYIIETLKMQGVEQFGDFAIQLRMKMMTKPGEQFAIRRTAYSMIKQRFAENGISFASPTVTVRGNASGDGEATAAAARQAIDALAPKPAADGSGI